MLERSLVYASIFAVVIAAVFFAYRRLLNYLRFFQQEEYESSRFINWVWSKRAFDRKGTLVALVAAVGALFVGAGLLITIVGAASLTVLAIREEDPRRTGKLKLVLTKRAKAILWLALLLFVASEVALVALPQTFLYPARLPIVWFAQIVLFQLLCLFLVAANVALSPWEKRSQARYLEDARNILRGHHLTIIGITGSYGKTSTKYILGELLQQALGPTLYTRRSVNTLMGVTREIRERLTPDIQFLVTEMGAYGQGSIKRLSNLTPPNAAIITSIGVMHLERFGTQQNIYSAKSELAQAVPSDGILVCSGNDVLCRQIASENPKKTTLLYGVDPNESVDCKVTNPRVTETGTRFEIHWNGLRLECHTKMHGYPALSNIAAAFTMACALGAEPTYVAGIIANLSPFDNRLQVTTENGVAWIRDAYNSNPIGFAAALDVLASLSVKRRILITPGMIELGNRQEAENLSVAEKASKICDMVFIVGNVNRQTWEKGVAKSGGKAQVQMYSHRDEAFANLNSILTEGDCVLIENDLPDLYEHFPRF